MWISHRMEMSLPHRAGALAFACTVATGPQEVIETAWIEDDAFLQVWLSSFELSFAPGAGGTVLAPESRSGDRRNRPGPRVSHPGTGGIVLTPEFRSRDQRDLPVSRISLRGPKGPSWLQSIGSEDPWNRPGSRGALNSQELCVVGRVSFAGRGGVLWTQTPSARP
jgi:hypothetical protein